MRLATLWLVLASASFAQQRFAFQEDLFREYDLYRNRLFDLARSIPEDKFNWRPDPKARSFKEVVLHVALNNYMLLDMMGRSLPTDRYPSLPSEVPARPRAIFQANLKLEKQEMTKEQVLQVAQKAFDDGAVPLKDTSGEGLNKPAMFGDRKTTQGGLQLRSVAHLHEHLGQLIAYARSLGVVPPWSQ